MKKFTSFLILALIAVFAFGGYVDAKQQRFEAQVYKYDLNKGVAGTAVTGANQRTTGITYKVLQRNSNSSETLLSAIGPTGTATTSKTNPVTTTIFASDGGRISFVCDPAEATDTYVDLIVTDTVGGYSAFIEDFTANMHAVVINETPGVVHHGIVPFTGAITETSTGVAFSRDTVIHDVVVEVVTVSSAATIDVGLLSSETSGDADGLRKGVLLTTAGYIKDTAVITSGASLDYTPVTTYGVLLRTAVTGTGATWTTKSSGGGATPIVFVVSSTNAKTLTYSTSTTTSSPAGYLHYWFSRIR